MIPELEPKRRRRILEKLKLTEISGVDNPCQEGARVAIMKRKEPNMNDTENLLEGALIDLEAQVVDLNKKIDVAVHAEPKQPIHINEFENTVVEIRKRDGCSRTDALVKARAENPNGFAAYNSDNTPQDFAALVAEEIRKGCPAAVAAQRVGLKYPSAAASVIEKAGKHPFEKVVDAIMEQDGCSRAEAMARARKKESAKFASYQGV
jgi:hypothetical protein